jgi:hypothetical protein
VGVGLLPPVELNTELGAVLMVMVVGMGVDDMLKETIEEQNRVSPCLYISRGSAWTNHGFKGSAIKGGYCQGFIKSHSIPGPNRLQPKGLKEYSDSYLISDYLRPVLGASGW